MLHILLAGKGRLGQETEAVCKEQGIPVTWMTRGYHITDNMIDNPPNVAVYCGKGNLITELYSLCAVSNIPLINASTDLGELKLKQPKCIFVDAPNASLPMLFFLEKF